MHKTVSSNHTKLITEFATARIAYIIVYYIVTESQFLDSSNSQCLYEGLPVASLLFGFPTVGLC